MCARFAQPAPIEDAKIVFYLCYLKSNVGINCYLNNQLLPNKEMSLKEDNWDMMYCANGRYVPDRIFLTEGLASAMGLMT